MAAYHLWHPAYTIAEPLTLEAFVTRGSALLPPRGDGALAEAALEAIGLELEPAGALVDAMRSHYFSSYRGTTGDWRDDWDIVWRVRIRIAGRAPALPDPPGRGYADVTVAGDPGQADDRRPAWRCLVLADADESSTIDEVRTIVDRTVPGAESVRGRAFGWDHQLRCDLGDRPLKWYEQGAAEAEDLLEAIAAAGASVRFDGSALRRG